MSGPLPTAVRTSNDISDSPQTRSEFAWFAALCDDDFEFLGVPTPELASSWSHCSEIVRAADRSGFDSILLPSGFDLGIDPIAFAGGVAPDLEHISLLVAVRCGEMWPPQLARQLGSLDEMLQGRLRINIISSDLPGETLGGKERYGRTLEVMKMLRAVLSGERCSADGQFYRFDLPAPRLLAQRTQAPPLYFGGLSPEARAVAAEAADVFLMWPDTTEGVKDLLADMDERSAAYGRKLRYGYRVHVIVRETESQAMDAARLLVSKLSDQVGAEIRSRSLDAGSFGVNQQGDLRSRSDADGFVEENLWTGIGRARSGCGAAIVGDPDQVVSKIRAYEELGISSFIFSGYPHLGECGRFADMVLPTLLANN
ncbi:MAG TPA: alkanesulfonate monooxygenase [Acidimicrobiaceae bacterium]|jgi:alkanesulfonate monooxygenase|nr:alkanesulfonate monooxygenase [Acidimicrobiaceae bacterium]